MVAQAGCLFLQTSLRFSQDQVSDSGRNNGKKLEVVTAYILIPFGIRCVNCWHLILRCFKNLPKNTQC